jgi:cysteine desulfurase
VKTEKKSLIYLDFNATTPVASEITEHIGEVLSIWGNPSSIHWAGQATKTVLREARLSVAKALNISPLEIVFTSGGSEANNTVLQSVFEKTRGQARSEFITSSLEHPSLLKTLEHLQSCGAVVHLVDVDSKGRLDWQHFEKVLGPQTALVSMMFANNETGLILPIQEIAEKAHAVGAEVHTDAVQAFGKVPLNLEALGVDYASFSAHKFYALKGCGILYCRKGSEIRPLIFGGGQERHRRGGTENTVGIWALGKMASRAAEISYQAERLQILRDQMEKKIKTEISGVMVNHEKNLRLPNTSSLVIDGVDGETLLMSLDVKGFAVSTGAACSSGNPEPSPVLLSLGLTREQAQGSLRVSLGWTTTSEQISQFIEVLKPVVHRLRSLSEDRNHEVRA